MLINRRNFMVLSTATAGVLTLGGPAFAMKPEIYTGILEGVGAGGFDVVAYFSRGAPVEGAAKYSHEWKGAEWYFSTAGNRALFAANPEKYAPQYGGHCAYAASKGALAKGIPEAWTIHDDKLYLNFSLDVRDIWRQDIPGNVENADANWPTLIA